MNKKILILVNPHSGARNGIKLAYKVKSFLDTENIAYKEVISQKPGYFTEWLTANKLSGYDLMVIVGGDGSLNEIINVIFKNQITEYPPLYLLPAGSGNALNHDLKNLDIEKAIKKINKCY